MDTNSRDYGAGKTHRSVPLLSAAEGEEAACRADVASEAPLYPLAGGSWIAGPASMISRAALGRPPALPSQALWVSACKLSQCCQWEDIQSLCSHLAGCAASSADLEVASAKIARHLPAPAPAIELCMRQPQQGIIQGCLMLLLRRPSYLYTQIHCSRVMVSSSLGGAKRKMVKIGTHSGSFHCDEALGCFLLRQTDTFKYAEIVRTRDESVLTELDVVIDVGGKYDPGTHRTHHCDDKQFHT